MKSTGLLVAVQGDEIFREAFCRSPGPSASARSGVRLPPLWHSGAPAW